MMWDDAPVAYTDPSTQLAMRHADVVSMVGQAGRWARAFGVRTNDRLADGSAYASRPLERYAVGLDQLYVRLWAQRSSLFSAMDQSFDTSTEPPPLPPPRKSGPTLIPEHLLQYNPTYFEGGDYVLWLRSTSRYHETPQQRWWQAVGAVERVLAAAGTCTSGLNSYATAVQGLWDGASRLVDGAYQDAVAATYGPLWRNPEDARPLVMWLKALTEVGFDEAECESLLLGFEGALPEAVAQCRSARSYWQRAAPSDS